jgi:hypothetical protein
MNYTLLCDSNGMRPRVKRVFESGGLTSPMQRLRLLTQAAWSGQTHGTSMAKIATKCWAP